MRQFITYSIRIIAIISILTLSCVTKNTAQIEAITAPDIEKVKSFGIEINGQIEYQFYQKYGFTDLEEQLIMIVRPKDTTFLTSYLPIDSTDIKRLRRIDSRKFKNDQPISLQFEKSWQSDIRIKSKEFKTAQDRFVFTNKGKYMVNLTDSTEVIYVYDNQTKLMYIESKK